MTNDNLKIQTFDDFLMSRMNKEQQVTFLKRLEENPELKAEFEWYKTLSEDIEVAFLKEELTDIYQSLNRKNKKKYTWISIAASITLIIGLFWFFQPSKNDALYTKYFIQDPGLPTVMGNIDSKYEFDDAMVDYKTENYKIAIEKWRALLEKQPDSDALNYYLGMAYLNSKDYRKASEYLQKNTVQTSQKFKDEALWYYALILVKQNRREEAVKILKQLDTAASKELLSQLSNDGG